MTTLEYILITYCLINLGIIGSRYIKRQARRRRDAKVFDAIASACDDMANHFQAIVLKNTEHKEAEEAAIASLADMLGISIEEAREMHSHTTTLDPSSLMTGESPTVLHIKPKDTHHE